MYLRTCRVVARLVLALVCLSLSLGSFVTAAHLGSVGQEEFVLSEGTPIKVITTREITSKEAKPNDPVNFTVSEDVVINGQVLVRLGTEAIGSVINAEKGGYMGKSGKLAIQVESTQTIDGLPLKLRAAKGKEGHDKLDSLVALSIISPLFLFKKGGEAKIAAGTPLTVYVAQERRFRREGSTAISVAVDAATGTVSSPDAIVYIYRPNKMVGRALEPSVFLDEVELARMDNGRYFAIKVKAGKHVVRLTDDKKGYALDMGAGQTYYFRIGIEAGIWKGNGKITLDEPDRAMEEIRKLKYLGKDKMKAPSDIFLPSPNS